MVNLMDLAEGVADVPKTRALNDLRTGSSINKDLLSKFEQAHVPAEQPRVSMGKVSVHITGS